MILNVRRLLLSLSIFSLWVSLFIIELVVNIPKNFTSEELSNGYKIRRASIDFNIPLITNARLATAFIRAFCGMSKDEIQIKSWDQY